MSKQPIYEIPDDDTSPIIGYGPFIPEESGIYEGQYVDFTYSEEEKEAITTGTGTHFHDASIIPTVQYQVYGLDNVWFWDNEGQNYSGNKGSEIMIQSVIGTRKSYYEVETSMGREENSATIPTPVPRPELGGKTRVHDVGDDALPTDPTSDDGVGDVYYKASDQEGYDLVEVLGTLTELQDPTNEEKSNARYLSTNDVESDDPAPLGSKNGDVYYNENEVLDPSTEGDGTRTRDGGLIRPGGNDEPGDEPGDEETEEVTEPYEFNKYLTSGNIAIVTITPSETLSQLYPLAIVTINGKEYDLRYLNEPLRLVMDKDYRISINWVWGSIVETFRINRK